MDNTSGAAILDRQDQSTKNTKDGSTVARPNISPLSTSSKKVSNTSATGNPRNKCALQPGHSLMDWIRLGNSGEDLAGTGGQLRPVTRSELSKHNSRQDVWLAIRGMVYNITRYLDFHPGGVEEIMRGAGQDATQLFTEVHAWVNYQQLLQKCRIGPLRPPKTLESIVSITTEEVRQNAMSMKPPKPVNPLKKDQNEWKSRSDWTQRMNEVTLHLYTRHLANPGFIIKRNESCGRVNREGESLEVWILLKEMVHRWCYTLAGSIQWPPTELRVSSESGKLELSFKKMAKENSSESNLWSTFGTNELIILRNEEAILRDSFPFTMQERIFFNQNSFCLMLKGFEGDHDNGVLLVPPVASHVLLELPVVKGNVASSKSNRKCLSKPYTPVPAQYLPTQVATSIDSQNMNFLIKSYKDRGSESFVSCLLESDDAEGDHLLVNIPKRAIELTVLAAHRDFLLLAAGSGLTPFLSLIDHLLKRNTNRIERVSLLYFNKTETDIWCERQLRELQEKDLRFEFKSILTGSAKDVSSAERLENTLKEILPLSSYIEGNRYTFALVCGPDGFTQKAQATLCECQFNKDNVYIF